MNKLRILLMFYTVKGNIEAKSNQKWYYSNLPKHIVHGFTLAEVLITLLIIGVVASIVIPALILDSQQAEMKALWRKAYGVASQACKLAIIDNGTVFGPYAVQTGLSPKWQAMMAHMNIIKSCHGNTFGNCWAPNGVTQQDGTYYSSVGCNGFYKEYQNATYAYVTADGMYWLVFGWGINTMDLIAVDVNGAKGPNMFGKDVFTFYMENMLVIKTAGCGYSSETINYLKGD